MSFTYDPNLTTAVSFVRLLIGDIDSTAALFQDEEIAAVIALQNVNADVAPEALAYFAAAQCLEILVTRWAGVGQGELEERVAVLIVKHGIDQHAGEGLEARIKSLREKGSTLNLQSGGRSAFFRSATM